MGTVISADGIDDVSSIFRINQEEALTKDGHQTWHRLVLHDFNNGQQFEGVIHKYETWSEPPDDFEVNSKGIRGEGDTEKNRERAARRAKKRIRHACKSAGFDRMLTLTTRDAIFDRDQFQKMIEKFIRLVRKASGDAMPYVLTVEKHDSQKTSGAKRGSLHAHVGVRGRQDYKLLQSVWNYRVCNGRGFVRVSLLWARYQRSTAVSRRPCAKLEQNPAPLLLASGFYKGNAKLHCVYLRFTLRPMIKSFAHKGLEKFFNKGNKAGIQAAHENRLRVQLAKLDASKSPLDMDLPAWKLHSLKGALKGHWAVSVSGNWRLTFRFDGEDAEVVDYQDYH